MPCRPIRRTNLSKLSLIENELADLKSSEVRRPVILTKKRLQVEHLVVNWRYDFDFSRIQAGHPAFLKRIR